MLTMSDNVIVLHTKFAFLLVHILLPFPSSKEKKSIIEYLFIYL